jgi:hypothetical protein
LVVDLCPTLQTVHTVPVEDQERRDSVVKPTAIPLRYGRVPSVFGTIRHVEVEICGERSVDEYLKKAPSRHLRPSPMGGPIEDGNSSLDRPPFMWLWLTPGHSVILYRYAKASPDTLTDLLSCCVDTVTIV